ncbi:MAG: prepilin-type N-terminal cleavage/methylation domain-containing protein [Patescibacteria group bacterium]|nr:prepilin-type N-terminal cleavage/methylation domain-containing protein [Patescibacteria group bacterium]MCL5095434.1 prepilin-type N-terminal cleavage/methylation domain-containing protein [Patescibacteria group bacterium]
MLKLKKIAGFTLIELLVVLVLIGILASIGILTNYPQQMKKTRDSKRKADMEKVRSALEMYRADSNCYPEALNFNGTTALTYSGRTYLDPIPGDATRYSYTSSGPVLCRNGFLLNASLETGGVYQVTTEGSNVIIVTPTPTPIPTPIPTPQQCKTINVSCTYDGDCCAGLACSPGTRTCQYSCSVYGGGTCNTTSGCTGLGKICSGTYSYPNSCVSSKPCCCVAGSDGGF